MFTYEPTDRGDEGAHEDGVYGEDVGFGIWLPTSVIPLSVRNLRDHRTS